MRKGLDLSSFSGNMGVGFLVKNQTSDQETKTPPGGGENGTWV
jgi:hypothetical protein